MRIGDEQNGPGTVTRILDEARQVGILGSRWPDHAAGRYRDPTSDLTGLKPRNPRLYRECAMRRCVGHTAPMHPTPEKRTGDSGAIGPLEAVVGCGLVQKRT